MATVYFLNIDKLDESSPINSNVDPQILKPILYTAQDMYILPILGTALFEEVKAQIVAGTLTALNTTLLKTYIQPCLTWDIMYEAPINMTYKYMNKAVVKRSSDSSSVPDYDELIDVSNKNLEKAQFYAKRLEMYLITNEASYPLYLNAGSDADTIHAKHGQYSTGLYLGEDGVRKSSLTYNKDSNGIELGKPNWWDCR